MTRSRSPIHDAKTAAFQAIRKGSLSFNFAARLLERGVRGDVVQLYSWCRWVDDVTDEYKEQGRSRAAALDDVEVWTFGDTEESSDPPPVTAMKWLLRRQLFPERYARELLVGMRMDLQERKYLSLGELLSYCYYVAGVVGIMLAYVMRARLDVALKQACDLGIAMQLTNIARDVYTDARMGRVYLPEDRLLAAGVSPNPAEILSPKNRDGIFSVVRELLSEADQFYQSGDSGLKYLPLRSAIAVAVAREIYAEIGQMILARGVLAWDARVWVPTYRKLVMAWRGLWKALKTVPFRLRRKPTMVPEEHR